MRALSVARMFSVGSSVSRFIMIDRMRHRLYYHIVWTTRGRRPLLNAELAAFLGHYLRSIARQERAHVLEMGIVTTHLHLLVRTDPQAHLSRLVQRFKGAARTRQTSSVSATERKDCDGRRGTRWRP